MDQLRPSSSPRIFDQNRLLGLVRQHSQFLSVPKLTPSFTAKFSWARLIFMRYFVSNCPSDWGLFLQGGESTLMALITRWQKGFKNDPFRQLYFLGFPMISGFK
jgi:hypothetical protein